MSLRKIILYIIIILTILAVVGSILGAEILKNRGSNFQDVTLDGDGVMSDTLAVTLDGFYPTLTKNFVINLRSRTNGNYKVKLQFEKTGDGMLENFLQVQFFLDGKEITSGSMSEFMQGRIVEFESALSRKAVKLEIFYTMPQEIGNEGQNATTNFNVKISAERV